MKWLLTLTLTVGATSVAMADTVRVRAADTFSVEAYGATAVYTVDADVAEASLQDGRVLILGRRAGSTQLVIVRGDEIQTSVVVVEAVAQRDVVKNRSQVANPALTVWQSVYSSETKRFTNDVDFTAGPAARSTRVRLTSVTRLQGEHTGDARSALPAVSLTTVRGAREFVFFDKVVAHSPLTVDGSALRGLHYRDDHLEVHAGYMTPFLYQTFLLPAQGEAAFGGSYRIARGTSTFAPTLYYFAAEQKFGGTAGTFASLQYHRGAAADRLRWKAEVGSGGGMPAGALDLTYDGARHRVMLTARHQSPRTPALGLGRQRGRFVEGTVHSRIGSGAWFDYAGSAATYDSIQIQQSTMSQRGDLRVTLGSGWTATAGGAVATVAGRGLDATVRSLSVPAGLRFERPGLSVTTLYRFQRNSAADRGGSGGRLNVHGSWRRIHASGFVDYQQHAATVDLVFREDPELARLFAEMGLAARTPEDVTRLLRDNAALVDLGYIRGATINLQPSHLQIGGDLSWMRGDAGQQLRAQVMLDRTTGTQRIEQTNMASVSYSHRVLEDLELLGSVSAWSRMASPLGPRGHWSFAAGARLRLNGAPRLLFARGNASIRGVVYRDLAPGAAGAERRGYAGVRLILDGVRETVTDAQGQFTFEASAAVPHQVQVILPDESTYFTTPSTLTVTPGAEISFGIAAAPARLLGTITSDAGLPVRGVVLRLTGNGIDTAVATDTNGRFRFAAPDGEYILTPHTDSLEPGYDPSALGPRPVRLTGGQPVRSDYSVPAQRSIAGSVMGRTGNPVSVAIPELNRHVMTDRNGRYVFRQLAPGTYTVVSAVDHRVARHVVEVPKEPGVVRVDLTPE